MHGTRPRTSHSLLEALSSPPRPGAPEEAPEQPAGALGVSQIKASLKQRGVDAVETVLQEASCAGERPFFMNASRAAQPAAHGGVPRASPEPSPPRALGTKGTLGEALDAAGLPCEAAVSSSSSDGGGLDDDGDGGAELTVQRAASWRRLEEKGIVGRRKASLGALELGLPLQELAKGSAAGGAAADSARSEEPQ
ncbi:unnamed protein product, partial [Prorocentrum cordatum]